MWKPKFLKKLEDDAYIEEYDDVYEDDYANDHISQNDGGDMSQHISLKDTNVDRIEDNTRISQELLVDVYQTPEEIVVRTMIAGVPPGNVDISLTRDMITITSEREDAKEVTEDNYFYRELSWGSFTRTIMLPAEVDVDEADAQERHGVLTIRLPKINKDRQAKVKVKSN